MERIVTGSADDRKCVRAWMMLGIERYQPREIHNPILQAQGDTWACTPLGAVLLGFCEGPAKASALLEELPSDADPVHGLALRLGVHVALVQEIHDLGQAKRNWGEIYQAMQDSPDDESPITALVDHHIAATRTFLANLPANRAPFWRPLQQSRL